MGRTDEEDGDKDCHNNHSSALLEFYFIGYFKKELCDFIKFPFKTCKLRLLESPLHS